MKLRLALAAILIVVGVALPLVAVAKRGPPWGFRGHQAVILETTGTVDVMQGDAHVAAKAGTFLDAGTEVRVPRYGEVRLKMPAGEIVVGDGTRAIVGDKSITVARGAVELRLPNGTTPFEVKPEGIDAKLTFRPGTEGALARVLADGQSEIRAFVKAGSAEAAASGGDELAETGKVVVVGSDKKPRIEGAPTALEIAPVCDGKKLSVDVPAGTQVFTASNLFMPKDGKVVVDVAGGKEVPVFARDVAGNFARAVVSCAPPAPGKK